MVCSGCVYADAIQNRREICPFCRAPAPKNIKNSLQGLNERLEVNDPEAFFGSGAIYFQGEGVVKDKSKGLEYYIRGAELGSTRAASELGQIYRIGESVSKDVKKARHYYELAAMRGDSASRCQLGFEEVNSGKFDKALKHWQISCAR
jgi:TPR repeat protein